MRRKLVIKKVRTTTLSVLIALLLLAMTISIAFAAPHLYVHIEVEEEILTSGETFYASGPAVDAGFVCPTGIVNDNLHGTYDLPGGKIRIINVDKEFVCGDSSGTFVINLNVRLNLDTNRTTASWNVISGTGDYAGLHGNGSLVGTPIVPGNSILDVYNGGMY